MIDKDQIIELLIKTLKYYANQKNHAPICGHNSPSSVMVDRGYKAREVLERIKNKS